MARYTIIWVDEGGATDQDCLSLTKVSERLADAGSASQPRAHISEVLKKLERSHPGDIVTFNCGWIVVRRVK